MAADPKDLTTVAAVKAYAPGLAPAQAGTDGTFDELLQRLVTAVSAQFCIEANTNPKQTTYTEFRHGHGQTGITLLNYPVLSVTSVKVDGALVSARAAVGADGWVFGAGGRVDLVGSTFSAGVSNVEIVYVAGYAAVPFDIEQAVIKMVALQFADRKRIGVASTSQAGTSTSFGDGPVLAYWRSVVDSYRVQAI